jgi:sugar lactone lactonase YvrE
MLPRIRRIERSFLTSVAVVTGLVAGSTLPAQPSPVRGERVRTVVDTLPGAVGGVTVDRGGTIYVADFGEQVFKVTPDGRVTVFATGLYGASGNAIDPQGNLFQSNFWGNYISRIDRQGRQEVFAEGLNGPVGIAIEPDGGLVVCNCPANSLSRVTPQGRVTEFVASDLLSCPNGIARGPDGAFYVVNFRDERMVKVTPDGKASEFARLPGGGNGHVTLARGHLYATSFQGHRVYRVSMDGDVTLFAGTGARGEANGPALEATFSWPNGIAAGPQGDRLFVNDFLNRFPPTVEAPPAPLSALRQITLETFASVLAAALRRGGIDDMRRAYREWTEAPATANVFTEVEVNALGYQLMGSGRLDAALVVFELNADSYPQSFNVWDSWGEAHVQAGNTERAIELYEKSLELNPANQNAADMLKRLRGS